MREPLLRTVILQAGTPLTVGTVTLVPIERVVLDHAQGRWHVGWSMVKEPYALLVRDAYGVRAISAAGAPIPVEVLREQVPGLDAVPV